MKILVFDSGADTEGKLTLSASHVTSQGPATLNCQETDYNTQTVVLLKISLLDAREKQCAPPSLGIGVSTHCDFINSNDKVVTFKIGRTDIKFSL